MAVLLVCALIVKLVYDMIARQSAEYKAQRLTEMKKRLREEMKNNKDIK